MFAPKTGTEISHRRQVTLSVDGGHTYPYVLAEAVPNTGSASVVLPMVGTTHARVKIEAVGNIFFDVSTADFAITWPFAGFFAPILNPPALNAAQAGNVVPLRFSLGGDCGLDILAAGYPVSVRIDRTSGATLGPPESTSPAGKSGLRYHPSTGQYVYACRTERAWRGTCRELRVLLVDGTLQAARFRFK
jgi:hypothetical protein